MEETLDYEKLAKAVMNMKIEEKNKLPWKEKLIKSDKGKIENCIENYLLYYNESEKYKGKLKYNDFLQQKEFNGNNWNDFNEDQAIIDIELETGLNSADKAKRAMNGVFGSNMYNPIQDYLNSLSWDGEERISEIFIKCFDITDTQLVRILSKKWFIAAVKRVFEPGCQFDNMIVLQGETGIGKTTFCRLLSNEFYSEIKFDEISNKDIVDKLNKSWIAIIDEMDNFDKQKMASIKSFLSVKKDLVRLAYARNTNVYQRHCIFIGSLNDETFLRDITSSVERRFWVFKCNKIKRDNAISEILTQETVNQLWAEAVHYYNEDPYQYLDVEYNLQDEFAKDQLQYKTFNDDHVIEWVKNILEKEYILKDNGEFNSDDDFLDQFNGSNVYTGPKKYINKIPLSSLIYVLNNKYKDKRADKTIIQALSDEWEKKPIWYYGRTFKSGLCRKEPKNCVENEIFEDLPI